MADISLVLGEGCGTTGRVTCKLEEPMVPHSARRRQVIAKWLAVLYLTATAAMMAWFVLQDTQQVTINTAPVSFEFDYKCKSCGTVNHIKEGVE